MHMLLHASLVSLLSLTVGCSLFIPKETRYLSSARDHATQEAVKQELGPPMLTAVQAGETVWVYQVREVQTGSRITASGQWCDEYVLTFDARAVLKGWTHTSQFHGGEVMPKYCVRDGYETKP